MSLLDLDEVSRRMPTLSLIEDDSLMIDVASITAEAPSYFWEVPASTSGYHHPLCRGDRGLWIHTLMLSTVIERLSDSYVELGLLDREDIDSAHAAAILHDQLKNGDPSDPSESSVSNHDMLMCDRIYLSDCETFIGDVAWAVETHMGPWYDGNEPNGPLSMLVHIADMIASTETITPGIQGPIPEELDGRGIEEVDLR